MNSERRGEKQLRKAHLRGVILGLCCGAVLSCGFCCGRPVWAPWLPELASLAAPERSEFDPPPQPFDEAKWKRGYATNRIAMAKTLTGTGVLVGQPREQVIAQLGPPDEEYEDGKELMWKLGYRGDGGLLINWGWDMQLQVYMDGEGKVLSAELYAKD